MKSGWRWGRIGVVVLAGATSCSPSQPPELPQELVWAVHKLEIETAAPVAELWKRAHPDGPAVRIEAIPASADDQRQLLAIELDAGLPRFDIVTLDVVWTGEFAARGWLEGLEGHRKKIAAVSQPSAVSSAEWKGKLWAAPFVTGAGLLYYRTDLVNEAPRTWAQLRDAVADARRKGGERLIGLVGQGAQYEGLVVNFLEYFWGAGGEASSRELSQQAAEKALMFMREAAAGGLYPPNFDGMREDDALAAFASGGAVFMRNWPYAFDALSPDLRTGVGIAPLPTFDGKGASAAVGGANLGVSRFSRNRAAAKEFAVFASTDLDVQVGLAARSRPPTLRSAYEHPVVLAKPLFGLLGRDILPVAHARPATPEWSTISDAIQQQVFPAYKGRIPVADAVTSIDALLRLATS